MKNRQVCHYCVLLPRDAGCEICDIPPAPVAVVLPERYDESQYRGTSLLAVRRWNACLDATAALNEVKS